MIIVQPFKAGSLEGSITDRDRNREQVVLIGMAPPSDMPVGRQAGMQQGEADQGQEVQRGCWLLGQACSLRDTKHRC